MRDISAFAVLLVLLTGFSLQVCIAAGATDSPAAVIAFHSDRYGSSDIYSIAADGSNEVRLTYDDAEDAFPSWSPDGASILFQSNRANDDAIYVMNVDGTNPRRIPNTENGRYAKWSHDGRYISFFAKRDGNTDIFIVDANGANPRNLTAHAATDETPSWTKDGTRLAFQSDRNDRRTGDRQSENWHPNFGIFTTKADGSDALEITGNKTNDENPSISPDGRHIVYQSYIHDSLAIVVVDVKTKEKHVLTDLSHVNGSPAWSSDGSKIVFDSNRDGNFEIFTMDADGSNQRQLTATDGVENSGAAMFVGIRQIKPDQQ